MKTLALSLASRPVIPSVQQEIISIVEFVKTDANGAGLADPDVIMFFGWVLGGIDRGAFESLLCRTARTMGLGADPKVRAGDAMLAVLAKATQRHPENEDVCVEAFLHYVRVGERKSAQQVRVRDQASPVSRTDPPRTRPRSR